MWPTAHSIESLDGGENFKEMPWGGDNHDIWFDPKNADRFVITDDGGMNITTVHGRGFHRVQLPIGQMYHVAVDNQVPYYFYSNMQDDGNMRGPSVPIGVGGRDRMGPRHGRLRIRLHGSGSHRSEHRVGHLLWQQSDALGRAHQAGPLGEPVADTLDSPPNEVEVSLPLDVAAGHRSVRSQHGVLRLPGDLQDHERRPELDGHQP